MFYPSALPGLDNRQTFARQSCRSTFALRRKPRDLLILIDCAVTVTVSARRRGENHHVHDQYSHQYNYWSEQMKVLFDKMPDKTQWSEIRQEFWSGPLCRRRHFQQKNDDNRPTKSVLVRYCARPAQTYGSTVSTTTTWRSSCLSRDVAIVCRYSRIHTIIIHSQTRRRRRRRCCCCRTRSATPGVQP
jgi:hypothetical protein